MKVREHRGGFEESMATEAEIAPTRRALAEHIRAASINLPDVQAPHIEIAPYGGVDERNGWDTHIVKVVGWGVWGFTDGPVVPDTEEVAHHIVDVLNGLLALDPNVENLFKSYVVVNDGIVEHPRAQVKLQGGSTYAIGVLGLLNAFTEGEKMIAAEVEEDGTIVGFTTVIPIYTPDAESVEYFPPSAP